MSGSFNRAQLIGNLGQDPESRSTQAGGRVVSFSVATSESWRDERTGERQERTEWHRIVIFNEKLGEIACKYLKKGSKIFLEGMLRTRKWKDDKDVERYTTEIQISAFNGTLLFLDRKPTDATAGEEAEAETVTASTEAAETTEAEPKADATRRSKKTKA